MYFIIAIYLAIYRTAAIYVAVCCAVLLFNMKLEIVNFNLPDKNIIVPKPIY